MLNAVKHRRTLRHSAGAQKSREEILTPPPPAGGSQISTVDARLSFANFTPRIPPIRVLIFSISRGFPLMMIASMQWWWPRWTWVLQRMLTYAECCASTIFCVRPVDDGRIRW